MKYSKSWKLRFFVKNWSYEKLKWWNNWRQSCKERGREWRGGRKIGEVAAWLRRLHRVWFLIKLIISLCLCYFSFTFLLFIDWFFFLLFGRSGDDFGVVKILYLNRGVSVVAFRRSEGGGCAIAITMWTTPDWGIRANVSLPSSAIGNHLFLFLEFLVL